MHDRDIDVGDSSEYRSDTMMGTMRRSCFSPGAAAKAAALLPALLGRGQANALFNTNTDCRYIPGDAGWPSVADWSELNTTVSGRLIETVPLARVCHVQPYNDYNETACAALQSVWTEAQT